MGLDKPKLGFWGLWNISFGFFGIQAGFALQNANVSRIFQSLGSDIDHLAFLWIAGPVTGMLVQPLVGHFSDRTWGRFGRRRPWFLGGAVLAALALTGMPNAGVLLVAALLLWMLDASLNISMEPFRAFVGDMTGAEQRTSGYAFQTAFIGAGAVLGSLAPAALTAMGIANTAPLGEIPASVRISFHIGAAAILIAVLWTVLSTREYSPTQMDAFEGRREGEARHDPMVAPATGPLWAGAGVAMLLLVTWTGLDRQLYVLGGALMLFGLAQIVARARLHAGAGENALGRILSDLAQMPDQMRRLAVAQFFAWLALFVMWIYMTPVVTQYVFGSTDTTSKAYNDGADWVGILFAVYNGVAALMAFALPPLARALGAPRAHMLGLLAGAASYAAIFFIRDAHWLFVPMVGVGIAWASILTMPYAILAGVLPQHKLGIYMGIFNLFIVLPQLLVATIMGGVIKAFFPAAPIWTMVVAAVVMALAALAMLRVRDIDAAGRRKTVVDAVGLEPTTR